MEKHDNREDTEPPLNVASDEIFLSLKSKIRGQTCVYHSL